MTKLKITDFKNTLIAGSYWVLNTNVNGYKNNHDNELATEAIAGRHFQIINNANFNFSERIEILLLEDGYRCWFQMKDLLNQIEKSKKWVPILMTREQIIEKVPLVLFWIEKASHCPNNYLWGGTAGPNFDCSGLIQTAFSKQGIWLPRDAYQQEKFCKPLTFHAKSLAGLIPGDLLFFGSLKRCSHVALYKGEGDYWHSSGTKNGRNGISIDTLKPINKNDISSYYLSILRGAGRVESCHDGSFIA